jgi:hypothetical protein
MAINVRNIGSVILKSGAEVAKFDCEGAEESLIQVPSEILRLVEFYMIEVHSAMIRKAIIEKFKASGFKVVNNITDTSSNTSATSIVYLKRES